MKGLVPAVFAVALLATNPAVAASWSFDSGVVVADAGTNQVGEIAFDCANSPYAYFTPDADLDAFVNRKGVTLMVTAGSGNLHVFPVTLDDLGTEFGLNDPGARELAALALVGVGFSAEIQYKGKSFYKSDFLSDGLSNVRDPLSICERAGLLGGPDNSDAYVPSVDELSSQQ